MMVIIIIIAIVLSMIMIMITMIIKCVSPGLRAMPINETSLRFNWTLLQDAAPKELSE